MIKRVQVFSISILLMLLVGCQNNKNIGPVTIHNDYYNDDTVYYSRDEFTKVLQEYGYDESTAKQFEKFIYNNGLREFIVEDASIIDNAIKYKKTYISSVSHTDTETYNLFYIYKKEKLYAFPAVNTFEILKLSDEIQYQYNFYKRKELVSMLVGMGLCPKNAILFEKKIYDSIFEVNYLLHPSIKESMHRYDVKYSFPVFEMTHKPLGILNIYHNNFYSTVNLQNIYNSCFPEQSKSFYDEQLRWHTLCNLEGMTFQLSNIGINQKELILDMKYMNNNLNATHIASDTQIINDMLSSNYTFALVDAPDNNGWNLFYKVADDIYVFSSKEFLSK